jgi:hypothetical protein
MPMQAMVASANSVLGTGSGVRLVQEFPEALKGLSTSGSLVPVARDVLKLGAAEVAYLRAIPMAVQESIRASIYSSVTQGKPVQISYKPSVEFEAQISDYGQALHIQVLGPYDPVSPGSRYARRGGGRRKPTRRSASRTAKRKPTRRRAR